MKRNSKSILLPLFTAVLIGTTFGQTKQQQRNIVVNGQNGKADVIDQNGRLFVDLLALASIGKGSLSFGEAAIILTLPALASGMATTATGAPPSATSQPANSSALSQEFMKAGIEEIRASESGPQHWPQPFGVGTASPTIGSTAIAIRRCRACNWRKRRPRPMATVMRRSCSIMLLTSFSSGATSSWLQRNRWTRPSTRHPRTLCARSAVAKAHQLRSLSDSNAGECHISG